MSDPWERLAGILHATRPRGTAEARVRAISAAMSAFDERYQGTPEAARRKVRVTDTVKSWLRRPFMPLIRPSLVFGGSLVGGLLVTAGLLAVLAGIYLNPGPTPLSAPAQPSGDAREFEFLQGASPEPAGNAGAEMAVEDAKPVAMEARRSVRPQNPPSLQKPSPSLADYSAEGVAQPVLVLKERVVSENSAKSVAGAVGRAFERPTGQYRDQGRDRFADVDMNPVKVTAEEQVSTFSIDVDTASYGFMRASLNRGVLPQQNAVRTEELINYFPYDYPAPESRDAPFAVHVSLLPTPWNAQTRLMHIAVKGYELAAAHAPPANLVFLIDTSGSMDAPDKLPLLIHSFKLLVGALGPEDTVAIVTYAGSAGVALEPTSVAEQGRILSSLERLGAGGSTAGGEGIRQAYLLAEQHFVEDGVNRVILATDGDFNVGITDPEELESYIARKRESGVFLSVLGFGMGNYNDELMQRLAQNGNGNAAYIDSLSEARKVLVEEATSTLFPIARDVKIQVEFNPATISEYRLIGYDTRMLRREDFTNDKVDAGEIGAGHTVTALYEVTPAGSGAERVPPLRYPRRQAENDPGPEGEFAHLRIRYKLPEGEFSSEMVRPVTQADAFESIGDAPGEARFAAAVAAFAQLLQGGRYTGDYAYEDVIALAQGARGEDPYGYRAEFISLVRLAEAAAAMAPLRR